MAHTVSLIPGDGIGPEVVAVARRVVAATGVAVAWDECSLGGQTDPVPRATIDSIRRTGVALKGPVATATGGARSANVGLRRALGLDVQLRPARSVGGIGPAGVPAFDLVVVRETTEDLYRGIELPAGSDEATELGRWLADRGLDDDVLDAGFSIKPATPSRVRAALEFTVDWMRRTGRRRLTVVHKATVMRATDGVYLSVADDVARAAPDVDFDACQVDAACAELVRRPDRFDVLFMPNMYGDLLSDLAAALSGGIGLAPGVNHGDGVAVFEAVHGSAPSHAGRDDVNPVAMVRCAAMLLDHLGEAEAAGRIHAAVGTLLEERIALTYDLCRPGEQPASTSAVGDALERLVSR